MEKSVVTDSGINDQIPAGIRRLTEGYVFQEVRREQAPSVVFRVTKPGSATLYLKTAPDLLPEVERLRWMGSHLPVARVLTFERSEADEEYLLMSEVPGENATALRFRDKPHELVRALAEGLRVLQQTSFTDCPFDCRQGTMIAEAERRTREGRVEEWDFEPRYQGRSAEDLFEELVRTAPPEDELAVAHGDYCLPNVLVREGHLGGFIDVGRAGISDPYRDIALCVRSLRRNWGEDLVPLLFDELGREPDPAKIEWYILLDEFF